MRDGVETASRERMASGMQHRRRCRPWRAPYIRACCLVLAPAATSVQVWHLHGSRCPGKRTLLYLTHNSFSLRSRRLYKNGGATTVCRPESQRESVRVEENIVCVSPRLRALSQQHRQTHSRLRSTPSLWTLLPRTMPRTLEAAQVLLGPSLFLPGPPFIRWAN